MRLRLTHLLPALLLFGLMPPVLAADGSHPPVCLILTGLGGVPEYEETFEKWAGNLEGLCRDQLKASVLRLDGRTASRQSILTDFRATAGTESVDVWLFLIGHANFDGRQYRFNIKGPDLTGADLQAFLDTLGSRRIHAVVATSASGELLAPLAGDNRVILTATRSGRERHPPLFFSFFLEAAGAAEADRNKDRRVSLQEVFEFCETRIAGWYEEKGRIRTEHAAMDDAAGTGRLAATAYLSAPAEQAYRSLEARELAPERIRLEREVEDLKLRKTEMPVEEYYRELERLLVALSELNDRIRRLEGEP